MEAARKALKKRAPKEGDHHVAAVAAGEAEARSGGLLGDAGGGGARGGTAGPSSCGAVTHEYYLMTEEVYRSRLQAIRAEELSVVKEKERLEVRGVGHAGMHACGLGAMPPTRPAARRTAHGPCAGLPPAALR